MSTIVFVNGVIYTMDAEKPLVEAVAIDQRTGTIVAVGSNDEVRRFSDHQSELVDLKRKTVIPGLIDAHIHLLDTAYRAYYVDAEHCQSAEEVAALVQQRAQQLPAGRWILGGHWYREQWVDQAFPHKRLLDQVAPEHPVALWSKDAHILWVNSLALRLAGIDAQTPDPAGGAILHDGDGEPTGVVQENATSLIFSVVEEKDPTLNRLLLPQIIQQLQRAGITSIQDIEGETSWTLFQELRAQERLGLRVQMILPRQMLTELREQGRKYFDDQWLRVGGIKIFADGTLGSQTAAMLDSFEGTSNRGILALSEQEMQQITSDAVDLGLSIAIHAIGDRAAHVALNSIAYAQQHLEQSRVAGQALPDLRYRLEHVQLIAPEDLRRMKRLGVVASVQPFHAVVDRDLAERYWGKRHRRAYAYNTMHKMGIPLAMGSDAPVDLFDPLTILFAATQRRDPRLKRPAWLPDQALSIADALWGYTMGAAYAGGEEGVKGSISVGKLGDLVVLRENLMQTEQAHLPENGVVATIIGGQVVYGDL